MSNPFLKASMEENTLDANDNNPLLKAEDPAKAAEVDGAKLADDYEYVESEAVDGENQKPDDAVLVDAVKDTTTEVNNIVKEATNTSDTLDAVASVSAEMYKILTTSGKLATSEILIVQNQLASLEAHASWIKDVDVAMPSMEDFKTPGLQYTTSQVAMESVVGAVFRGLERMAVLIQKIVSLGIGAARKHLSLVGSRIERAQKLMTSLDNSHREAGLKEISGGFAKALLVDGKAPDATTVLKTAAYTNVVAKEFLGGEIYKQAENFTKTAAEQIFNNTNLTSTKQPSGVLTTLCIILGFSAASTGSPLMVLPLIKVISDTIKTQRTFKMDPSVSPQIFKMFPNISKLNYTGDEVDECYDCKRSLPLFGDKTLYAYQLKNTLNPQSLSRTNFPSVILINEGSPKGNGFALQALNSSQQKDVLTSAINMLVTAKEYYDSYAERAKSLYRVNQEGIAKGKALQKQGDNVGRQWAGALTASTMTGIYRVYWSGLLEDQSRFAAYLVKTADQLIQFVEASSAAAKANVEGSASQEAIAIAEEVKNPFM